MDRVAVEEWLEKHGVKNHTINEDLSVDVNGGVVNLASMGLVEIPIRFGVVSGSFYCSNNQLVDLVGCPITIGASFH